MILLVITPNSQLEWVSWLVLATCPVLIPYLGEGMMTIFCIYYVSSQHYQLWTRFMFSLSQYVIFFSPYMSVYLPLFYLVHTSVIPITLRCAYTELEIRLNKWHGSVQAPSVSVYHTERHVINCFHYIQWQLNVNFAQVQSRNGRKCLLLQTLYTWLPSTSCEALHVIMFDLSWPITLM